MKKLVSGLLIVIFSCVISFNVLAESDRTAEGASLYNNNCSRCHNARPAQEFSEREWSVIMPHMREKAHLTGSETLAVEAFIAVTFTAEKMGQSVAQIESESGEDLVGRFVCGGCHQIGGVGGKLGPDLGGIVQRMGAEFVIRKLLEPTFNNPASAMPSFPITPEQAEKIADLLRSTQ